MSEKLATELGKTVRKAEKVQQRAVRKESSRRAAALAVEEARAEEYAAEITPLFVDKLREKLRAAARERQTSASIRWVSSIENHARGARRAMEITAEHFQDEGLLTKIDNYNNAHEGTAHGDLEERNYYPATEWTVTLTASLPTGS